MISLALPQADGTLRDYALRGTAPYPRRRTGAFNRTVYAAAHVVVDPTKPCDPWTGEAVVDWEATLAFRRHLWGLGFKIAEAMDTAQRGMGLGWPNAKELIRRSLDAARDVPGADLASGAGSDQLAPGEARSLDDVVGAYEEQIEAIEGRGGRVILMASRALAALARSPDDYLTVYGRLLPHCRRPVVLHWLGDMFDPELKGYWGGENIAESMETVLALIAEHAERIEGIKISLLDARWEIEMRRRLPAGVKMFTGDDFNYAELIEGDGEIHSHALLGIFDPIAPAASAALARLADNDAASYREILAPTVALSREIFREPTQYYKAGVVFLAWLNGHQSHFTMAGGLQSARSLVHYARVFELADRANLLADPDSAARRMRRFLALQGGIEA